MNLELAFDPLFRMPFLVGLIMSAILPLLGNLLRLRDEWLAALGLAYLAGQAPGGLNGQGRVVADDVHTQGKGHFRNQ